MQFHEEKNDLFDFTNFFYLDFFKFSGPLCMGKTQQGRVLNLMLIYTSINAGCQTIEAIRIGCKPRDDIWQSRCWWWWCGVFSAFKAEAT